MRGLALLLAFTGRVRATYWLPKIDSGSTCDCTLAGTSFILDGYRSSLTPTLPSGARPSLATLPTVTYRYSTGAPMTTALLPVGNSESSFTTLVK